MGVPKVCPSTLIVTNCSSSVRCPSSWVTITKSFILISSPRNRTDRQTQRCITNNYPVTIIRIKLTEHLHPHYLLDCKYLAIPNSHPVLHLPKLLFDGPIDAALTIALAHGAGLSTDAPFMTQVASELAERGLCVARFNFPYMDKIEETGKRRPPDRPAILMQT